MRRRGSYPQGPKNQQIGKYNCNTVFSDQLNRKSRYSQPEEKRHKRGKKAGGHML